MLNSVYEFVYWHVNGETASSYCSGPPTTMPLSGTEKNMKRLGWNCKYALDKRERGKISLMDQHAQERGKWPWISKPFGLFCVGFSKHCALFYPCPLTQLGCLSNVPFQVFPSRLLAGRGKWWKNGWPRAMASSLQVLIATTSASAMFHHRQGSP